MTLASVCGSQVKKTCVAIQRSHPRPRLYFHHHEVIRHAHLSMAGFELPRLAKRFDFALVAFRFPAGWSFGAVLKSAAGLAIRRARRNSSASIPAPRDNLGHVFIAPARRDT